MHSSDVPDPDLKSRRVSCLDGFPLSLIPRFVVLVYACFFLFHFSYSWGVSLIFPWIA